MRSINMAEPVRKIFQAEKNLLMDALPECFNELNLMQIGENRELGLMSFRVKSDMIYYVQISPATGREGTEVAIAPGLPNLKERDSSEIDRNMIEKITQKLEEISKSL